MGPALFARAFEIAEADGIRIGAGNPAENGEELLTDFLSIRAIRIGRED